jgi:hypothetical protein
MDSPRHWSLVLAVLFVSATPAAGQKGEFLRDIMVGETDTSYIGSYISDLTARIYGSVKAENLWFSDRDKDKTLKYEPNNRMLLGIGANHGLLGLNLGFNLPFINDDDGTYGTTDYLNLTTRVYGRKVMIDGYLQAYRGFFLRNSHKMIAGWPDDGSYYLRADIRSYTVGISIQYLFNSSKFSYRAAFLQNEWQKKSAGSLQVGGDIIYHITLGDSSLVPAGIAEPDFFDSYHFKRSDNFSLGPNIGYAYTFVLKSHWFATLAVTGTLATGGSWLTQPDEGGERMKSGPAIDLIGSTRIALGYNSAEWYFGLSYVDLRETAQAPVPGSHLIYTTSNFRFNLVKRFYIRKPLKLLNPEA